MDDNQRQDESQSKREEALDYVRRAQDARGNVGRARALGKNAKTGGKAVAKGGRFAGRAGAQVARQGVAVLVETSETWVPILLIIIGVILVIIIITGVITAIFGSAGQTPACDSITASAPSANYASPVMLTLENCTGNASISWESPSIGGTFSPQGPTTVESTVYTPPLVTAVTAINIVANVCNPADSSKCNYYSVQLTVNTGDCSASGGSCMAACSYPIPGYCSTAGTVCCGSPGTPPGSFKFFCQYDNDYTKYSSSLGTTCRIDKYGCTPTSVAMITYTFGKTTWNPFKVAVANGGEGCFVGGSSAWDFQSFMKNQGFTVRMGTNLASGSYFNVSLAKQRLSEGCYLLTAADMSFNIGNTGRGGHATVITGIDSNNRITMKDPTWCSSDASSGTRFLYPNGLDGTGKRVIFSWWSSYAICP